jgi:hypothetical protein
MATAGKCRNCGVMVIWVGRWVHVLDGGNPASSTCNSPEREETNE